MSGSPPIDNNVNDPIPRDAKSTGASGHRAPGNGAGGAFDDTATGDGATAAPLEPDRAGL